MKNLENFNNFLLELGQSPSTVRTNIKMIGRVLRVCCPLSYSSFQLYINTYIRQGKARTYIKQIIIAVRLYAQFAHIHELAEYPYPKLQKKQTYKRARMSNDEIESFLKVINPYPHGGFYWRRFEMFRIFWHIGAYHGNRPGEAAKLRKYPTKKEPSTIDIGRNLFIFQGKNRTRELPIHFHTRGIIKQFYEQTETDYFFPSVHKSKLPYINDFAWQQDFKKRIRLISSLYPGIDRRLNLEPYSLRKTAASRWDRDGWSLRQIQEALGHSRLDTTQKYIDVDPDKIEEMINNDSLALRHKKGIDLVKKCYEVICNIVSVNKTKLLISSVSIKNNGRRYCIVIDAID